MALTTVILRKQGKLTLSPAQTLQAVNNDLERYIANTGIAYVTAFYCVIDFATQTMTYAKAGHLPALFIQSGNQTIEEIGTDGLFLGMYIDETYEEKQLKLNSGDTVVLYTDGITEATNANREEFGLPRFKQCLLAHQDKPVSDIKDAVLKAVSDFSGNVPSKDDQTLVIFRWE